MTVYTQRIYLAPHEWGGELMRKVAEATLAAHDNVWPLVVFVHEHGGWWLAYAVIDGAVRTVYSANDIAMYPDDVRKAQEQFRAMQWEPIGADVRRQ